MWTLFSGSAFAVGSETRNENRFDPRCSEATGFQVCLEFPDGKFTPAEILLFAIACVSLPVGGRKIDL